MPLLNLPLIHHRREQHKELFHVHPIKHSRSTDSQTDAVDSKPEAKVMPIPFHRTHPISHSSTSSQREAFRSERPQADDDRESMWTIRRFNAFEEIDSDDEE